jgi:NitT/TauT family transport system substrate-binding protein
MADTAKCTGKGLRALVYLVAICCSATVRAADKAVERPLEKVTIAYSSISGNMAPLWITHERGLFRKHGLDVRLIFIESGSTTVQSLVSGNVAFAQMAGAGVLQSRLRGSDVVMIAGVVNTLTFKFYVEKTINRPEQLKGKSVAVTRFGSSTDFALRYALEKYGLKPERDVAIIESGNMPAIFAALESGWVQGAMLSSPFTGKARNVGLPLLADLQMLGLEYQHTGMATTETLIRARPDLVRSMMKAYAEGIHYYKTHRSESLAILAKYLRQSDAEVLTEVYEDIGIALTPEKPYPTVRGIEVMLRELAGKDPRAKSARAGDFVNLAFVRELDASGFIDGLYKAQPVIARREQPRGLAQQPAPEQAKARAAAGKPTKQSPLDDAREYIVQAGDTLSGLALRYYGDLYRWNKIYEANRATMNNPNYIYVGQKIFIPA